MDIYRCYFLDTADRIKAAENIEADTLAAAIERALAMLRQRSHHHSIEIWRGGKCVYPEAVPGMSLGGNSARVAVHSVAFMRLAAAQMRRLVESAPEIAVALRDIADKLDAQAKDFEATLPPQSADDHGRPV